MTKTQEKVFAFVCGWFDENGYAPTVARIGEHFGISGISGVGAWKHVKALIEQGRLVRLKDRRIVIPGRIDLRPVPTDALVAELARRRGVSHAEASGVMQASAS